MKALDKIEIVSRHGNVTVSWHDLQTHYLGARQRAPAKDALANGYVWTGEVQGEMITLRRKKGGGDRG